MLPQSLKGCDFFSAILRLTGEVIFQVVGQDVASTSRIFQFISVKKQPAPQVPEKSGLFMCNTERMN